MPNETFSGLRTGDKLKHFCEGIKEQGFRDLTPLDLREGLTKVFKVKDGPTVDGYIETMQSMGMMEKGPKGWRLL
jgi:hypothetical protein